MKASQLAPYLRLLCDRKLWALILPILLASGATAETQKDTDAPEFVRVKKDADGNPISLQTAIARYTSTDDRKIQIDLIGAVHIGEDAYYQELNKRFPAYDAVMYELVAPEGTRVPKGGKGTGSAVGGLQHSMKDMLELEFQLEKIDYSPENFVHADMTPEEFAKDMEERGDSFMSIIARAMGQGLVQQSKKDGPSDSAVLMALFSKDRAMKLRRIFASQIQDMDSQMRAIEGPNGGTLIAQRNAKAFRVMADQIDQGRKKIGVFYGAGHLDDMHERLLNEFGMKLESVEYLDAWNLK